MAFYALDEDDLIFADIADPKKTYWCLECFGPVKRRKGRQKFAHFYHLKAAFHCRLYSKSEDHFLAQVELQKYFPKGEIQVEKPFIQINRVADGCWEKKRIIFEIQCSPISEKEAEMRARDYQSIGYEIVWLLDDKRYNKRTLRPAEEILRRKSAYYLAIRSFKVYDQFEIFLFAQRVRRSRPMQVELQKIGLRPNWTFDEKLFPKQLVQLSCPFYFAGDRLHRALQKQPLSMLYWRSLEIQFAKSVRKKSKIRNWLNRYIVQPYFRMLAHRFKNSWNSF